MKIPIRIKPGGPKPTGILLIRRVGKIHLTTNKLRRQVDQSGFGHNWPIEWPAQVQRGEARIFRQAASRTVTRLAVGFAALLALGNAARAAIFRYASSNNRIYVENGGTVTLTDIKAALPHAPLQLVDAANKIWLLGANLLVADGATLSLQGDAVGGEVNELRLLSNKGSATNAYVSVDANWGTLDLNATRIPSWDPAVRGPDTEHRGYQRAFIRARSRVVGLASNAVPTDAAVKLVGAATNRTTTVVKGQEQMRLQLDANRVGRFEDDRGEIFDAGPGKLDTVADGDGSFAVATLAEVGVSSTILKRNFYAVPDAGSVIVTPGAWNLGNNLKLTWDARASASAATIRYTIGNLSSGAPYTVAIGKLGAGGSGKGKGKPTTTLPVGRFTADSQGYINFSTQPGTTTTLTYSVVGL